MITCSRVERVHMQFGGSKSYAMPGGWLGTVGEGA